MISDSSMSEKYALERKKNRYEIMQSFNANEKVQYYFTYTISNGFQLYQSLYAKVVIYTS